MRVATVQQVRIVSAPPYPDAQIIDATLYGPLTKHDGQRARTVQPEKVIRILDAPPLSAAKALTSLWSPRDGENPFQVESQLTNEAWREISLWYPFSVRVLKVQDGEAKWHEQARTRIWDEAKEAMNTLAPLNREKSQSCWVVMKCERRGKEGREKPVMWYPGQRSVHATLREVGLLKTTEASTVCSDSSG